MPDQKTEITEMQKIRIDSETLHKIEKINNAILNDETIVFGADCEIKYSGRAETYLARGDRMIIIKADKTLLVHQPHGSTPINYMKEDSSHRIIVEDDKIFLKSRNIPLKEYIDVLINDIHFMHSSKMSDSQKIQLTGDEKDMSDMIARNPCIVEEGLRLVSQEEQTKYGFIDLLCFDKDFNLVVIECKRYKADPSAVTQLRRYVEKIRESKGVNNVRGILAAPSISRNAEKMISDWGFKFAAVEPPKYMERFKKDQKTLGEY